MGLEFRTDRFYERGSVGSLSAPAVLAKLAEDGPLVRAAADPVRVLSRPVPARLLMKGDFPDLITCHIAAMKGNEVVVCGSDADQVVIGGSWHPVEVDSLEAVLSLAASHGIDPGNAVTAGRYLSCLADPEFEHLMVDRLSGSSDLGAAASLLAEGPPLGLKAKLFPYQATGSARLRKLARAELGSLLADEMGLGKTLQVITVLLEAAAEGVSLVIAPASLLINWERELGTFAPVLAVTRHAGPFRTGVVEDLLSSDVVLVSFDTLLQDVALFRDHQWQVVVVDEAQGIRNPDARRSRVVKSLDRRVSVAVTGTPLENRLQDTWSLGEFVLPSLLGDRETFLDSFPDEHAAAVVVGRLMSPVTVRRRVSDVATDLPPLFRRATLFELDSEDARAVRALPDDLSAIISERMVCAHATLPAPSRAAFAAKPKVSHLLTLLSEVFARGEKALVFASFTATLDRLADLVLDVEPRAAVGVLDGRIAQPEERHAIIDQFNSYDGFGVLFLNPTVAGVGLNITGANHVVHFQPEWNPAVEDQATKRAHRRGQSLPVSVHTLVYAGTVDERAWDLQAAKRDVAEGLSEGLQSTDDPS